MSKAATRSEVMGIISAYSGQQNVIAIPRIYIEMCGDYNRAAILNQILYWSERTSDQWGWFYKSYDEWMNELGLTEYQIRRSVQGDKRNKDNSNALINLGVETTLRKDPNGTPKVHYRVNHDVFVESLTRAIEHCKEWKPNNVKNGNQTMLSLVSKQCKESLKTETTTKNTYIETVPILDADDFQSKIAIVRDAGLISTSDFVKFKQDSDDYTVEQWQVGVNRVIEARKKDGKHKGYKYLLSVMSSIEAESKQAALIEASKAPKFVIVAPLEIKRPSVTDGMIDYDTDSIEGNSV